jgi:ABC-type uncharacterized transport system involved in gliding motility auxiliary subunit
MKTTHPVTRAALGVAALVTIALLANWLVTLTPAGNHGADFTENKTHTLSAGTRAILTELDTPVVLRYYATRESNYLPEQLKLHMRRVDDLLKEYASLSKGKLRIENLDPQPDTDAEDSANLDGINGQRINEQNLYFGIAITCLDKTSVLPFLNPGEETMLEYQLSKAIGEVSTATKPKIGIMSALNLQGTPAMMPGQPTTPGWVVYQQLKQSFEVVDISMEAATIDPKQIKVLLLFHPAGITPAAEYSVDQYLLHGGTVVACLDPYSVAAKMTSKSGGNPMMGGQQPPNPTTSTLPTLLSAWGVTFESGQVLADPSLATKLGNGREGLAVLTLGQEMMPQKDNVITKDITSVTLFLPGAFTKTGATGITADTLLRASDRAGFVDAEKASQLDPTLARSLKSNGTVYDIITHLTGKFKTAFPDGKPKPAAETPPDKDAPKFEHLKEASENGNVFLIGDIDAFYDDFAYSIQKLGGTRVPSPINGNSSLLFNLLDQTTGSKHLIGSRSRAAISRPFTVIQKMEADFIKTVGVKIEEFQVKQKAAQEKLSELQNQKSRGNELYLSPAQEAEIKKLREEQVEYAKLIRGQEKELRRQKDKLAGNITLLNVAAMPALVVLIGFALFIKRRSATRAR